MKKPGYMSMIAIVQNPGHLWQHFWQSKWISPYTLDNLYIRSYVREKDYLPAIELAELGYGRPTLFNTSKHLTAKMSYPLTSTGLCLVQQYYSVSLERKETNQRSCHFPLKIQEFNLIAALEMQWA